MGEVELGGGGGALDVVRPASADYGDVHRRVREGPDDREPGDGVSPLPGELLWILDLFEVLLEVLALEVVALARPLRGRRANSGSMGLGLG